MKPEQPTKVGVFGDVQLVIQRLINTDELDIVTILTRCPELFEETQVHVSELKEPHHECISSVLETWELDVIVTAGFPVILTSNELNQVDWAINLHKGLLPKNRGRHAIATAFDQNMSVTGVTVHKLAANIDAGELLSQSRIQIRPDDNYDSIQFKTDIVGADLVKDTIKEYHNYGYVTSEAQKESLATYYSPRTAKDSQIDWNKNSEQICKLISTSKDDFTAFSILSESKVMINKSSTFDEYDGQFTTNFSPGTILERTMDSLLVVTGSGTITITDYISPDTLTIRPGNVFEN
jgi:methionyl-tRNA formyltransferase